MALGLEGTPLPQLNRIAVGLTFGLLVASLLGLLLDALPCIKKARKANSYPRPWVLIMLVCSYALLIPALWAILFSFNIGSFGASMKASTDSMLEFIDTLGTTGSWWGAALVTLFSIAIPIMKIVLLICGECYRHSEDPRKVMFARRSILFVRAISKWACPDMMAYIFLLYLVRSLNHPDTLEGLFKLDVGFTCYTLFCVGSTVSSLGVHVPTLPESTEKVVAPRTSRNGSAALLTMFTAGFVACLTVGLIFPCMALRLDIQALVHNNPLVDESMIPFLIDTLHLPDLAKAEVTIPRCIGMLSQTQSDAFDANAILAIVMLAVFVVGFTVFDMIALIVAAFQSLRLDLYGTRTVEDATAVRHKALAASSTLKKLSMLDVTILGIVIVVASGTVYKQQGLILSFRPGLLGMLGAEICHYATYFFVHNLPTAQNLQKNQRVKDTMDTEIGNSMDEDVVNENVVPRATE